MAIDPLSNTAHLQIQREFYEGLMVSQYAPPAERQAGVRRQLAKLLRHAKANAPFYRNRLDAVVLANGTIDWSRWNEIPILARKEVIDHRETMRVTELTGLHRGPTDDESSSGSTGVPVTVSSTRYSADIQAAGVFRTHVWHDLDWSRDLLIWQGDDPEVAAAPDGTVGASWGPAWVAGATGRAIFINRFTSPEGVLNLIARNGIRYLAARPKAAHSLALAALRIDSRASLDMILTFGTEITSVERADCREAFGAKMIGAYSSKEGHLMGYQCPTGEHFHLNEEAALVEILNDRNDLCAPGELGRVIVTPLFNFAQPMIRYEQTDLAVPGRHCGCGRTLGVIDRIAGRTTQLFRMPDGRQIAPSLAIGRMHQAMDAKYWQLAQVGSTHLELRYVPFGGGRLDEPALTQMIRSATHPEMTVTFHPRTDLARTDGGKFMEFACELPD